MRHAGTKLLFVDDEPAVGRAYARLLSQHGFVVDVAEDGVEGVRMANAYHYPVVVTDLRMPRMDGMTLIRRLRTTCPHTSFVILSGLPEVDVPQGYGALPIASILAKPCDPEELIAAIGRALSLRGDDVATAAEEQSLLLVEDNPGDVALVSDFLCDDGHYRITHAGRLNDALALLHAERFDVVVADLTLPDARGLDTVIRVQKAAPESAVIVLSDLDDDRVALEALRAGAQDYLVKGNVDRKSLTRSLGHASERKAAERRLIRLARYDQLTGLANRSHFRDELLQAMKRARRTGRQVAAMFLDLDGLKEVNDTFGHDAGDQLLQRVAGRLERCVREYDTVARLGGDEFAIVLDDLGDAEQVHIVAERILLSFRDAVPIGDESVAVTTSIGVAVCPDVGGDVDGLLKAADRAMYIAKEQGGNRCVSAPGLGASSTGPCIAHELRNALTEGRYVLHYQPQWRLSDGSVSGAEALLRLRGRDGALIPPGDFISVLENDDHIVDVGAWVLNEACADAAAWSMGSRDVCVAVNLSARQFEHGGLIEVVKSALERTGLAPGCLELEITEGVLMGDTISTNSALAELKRIGVRIAIDDFGTGYSSLAYLDRFEVDVLKIDRSFIRSVIESRSSRSIASAIIALGHNLDLRVVAEGVETEEQLAFLQDEGCDVAQGYLLGRPHALQRTIPRLIAAA